MPAKLKLNHIAIPAQDPTALSAFYTDFLGMTATLNNTLPNLGPFVFLSDNPAETFQSLALISKPEAKHIAWEAESLGDIKSLYADAQARGIHAFALNHKTVLSLYVRDPEGNSVEIFWQTGSRVRGLFADPVDPSMLAKSDEEIVTSLGLG